MVLLLGAFLLPNIGALFCGYVLDDMPIIVENEMVHSLRHPLQFWKNGYWPDRPGMTAYRPVTTTTWAGLWVAGRGHAIVYHAAALALGALVVVLLYWFFLEVGIARRIAFIAAALFALFPIHTEATTSVVGMAELLAAAFGLGSLLLYHRGRLIPALLLFALAVFSKESAAAFAALPVLFPPPGRPKAKFCLTTREMIAAGCAAAVIATTLIARIKVSPVTPFIPPIDNPMGLVDPFRRVISALWIQWLYIWKTFVPITLSADYSYKEIPLVMDPDEWRAAIGVVLVLAAAAMAYFRKDLRPAILSYAVLFSPTANLLFPIGTMMGERLVYLPSLGLALFAAVLLARVRRWREVLLALALVYGARTVVRNLDWRSADTFYPKLLRTSPDSAKSYYFYGTLRASHEDDAGAIRAYDQAIAIFPAYAEAYNNRGNAYARMGDRAGAIDSFRSCLQMDPGNIAVAMKLQQLQAGLPVYPPRKKL